MFVSVVLSSAIIPKCCMTFSARRSRRVTYSSCARTFLLLTHSWMKSTHARTHTLRAFAGRQSSICAPAVPDILWPLGQRQGVVWPRGVGGVPSCLQALGEPSCAADCRCPPVLRICAAFLLFLHRLHSWRWLAKQAAACKHSRSVRSALFFFTRVQHCYRQGIVVFVVADEIHALRIKQVTSAEHLKDPRRKKKYG